MNSAYLTTSPLFLYLHNLFKSPSFWLVVVIFALFFGVIDSAYAADATAGGGAGLPWEGPIQKISRSFSGPVAFGVALLGIIACGATLIWGGEVSEFIRRIIYVVLVVCVIVFANTLLTGTLFSGAVVPADAHIMAADLTAFGNPASAITEK